VGCDQRDRFRPVFELCRVWAPSARGPHLVRCRHHEGNPPRSPLPWSLGAFLGAVYPRADGGGFCHADFGIYVSPNSESLLGWDSRNGNRRGTHRLIGFYQHLGRDPWRVWRPPLIPGGSSAVRVSHSGILLLLGLLDPDRKLMNTRENR